MDRSGGESWVVFQTDLVFGCGCNVEVAVVVAVGLAEVALGTVAGRMSEMSPTGSPMLCFRPMRSSSLLCAKAHCLP